MVETNKVKAIAVPLDQASRIGLIGRYLLAMLGIVFVGLGWLGTFVPGLPTVGFLVMASFCFARSCPWLEQRLIRNRFFARFLQYLDGDCEMPPRARYAAIGMMWASIACSLTVLWLSGRAPWWLFLVIAGAGLIGNIFILRFRRNVRSASVAPTSVAPTSVSPSGRCPVHSGWTEERRKEG